MEVVAGGLFVFLVEAIGGVDAVAGEELFQDFGALGTEDDFGDPPIFLPDLSFVFLESVLWLTEDAQVHIHKHCGIGVPADFVGFRREDQRADGLREIGRDFGFGETALRQFGALLFVVRGLRIVDHIVKPDCDFDRIRLRREMAGGIEFSQAFGNVLLVVVIPLRFGVGGCESFVLGRRIT